MTKFLKVVSIVCIACLVILGIFHVIDWERILYLITLLGGLLIGNRLGSNGKKNV